MIRIGVTETYDPNYDMNWINKLVDLNILITKSLTNNLINAIMEQVFYKYRIILHHTVTGWGGTPLEPNVMTYEDSYNRLLMLLACGFPREQVVLRLDPIIPTKSGLHKAIQVLQKFSDLGITRCRISVLDMYPHVRERLSQYHGPNVDELLSSYNGHFTANREWFERIDEMIGLKAFDMYKFEVCGERYNFKNAVRQGCVSEQDVKLFNLPMDDLCKGGNRLVCNCLNKEQLLGGMSRGRCPNQCIYCYLK